MGLRKSGFDSIPRPTIEIETILTKQIQTPETPGRWAVLLVTTLAGFLIPFMGSSVNIALPTIGKELSMHAVALGWVATSYLLASAMLLVPFGRLADIYGRKKVFSIGMIIYTVGSLVAALSNSAAMLIATRVVQGIGGSMLFSTGVAILTSVFPARERGRALGINVAAVYLGLSAGPFLGGLLTQYFGWRSVFLLNVPLGLIVIAAVFWKLRGDWAEAKGERFDIAGSVIYSLTLVALIYGFTLLPGVSGAILIAAGALGLSIFVWWEMRADSPVLNIGLFRQNTVFAMSNLAALINYSATFAVAFLLSLYLQYIKGLSPRDAGIILVAAPVVQAIFSPMAGRLSDRVEPRIVASAGMGLTAVGLLMFTFLDGNTGLGYIVVSLMILGLGFALFSSPNTNAVMSSVESRFLGVASATLATMRQMGMMLSMGLAMLLFALNIGRVQIAPEHYPMLITSVHTAFIIFTVFCAVGIFASLARGKVR